MKDCKALFQVKIISHLHFVLVVFERGCLFIHDVFFIFICLHFITDFNIFDKRIFDCFPHFDFDFHTLFSTKNTIYINQSKCLREQSLNNYRRLAQCYILYYSK